MSASIINKDSIYTISTQDFLKHQSLVRYLKLKLRIVDTEDQLNYLEIEFIKHKIKKTKPRRNEQIKEFSKYNYKSS